MSKNTNSENTKYVIYAILISIILFFWYLSIPGIILWLILKKTNLSKKNKEYAIAGTIILAVVLSFIVLAGDDKENKKKSKIIATKTEVVETPVENTNSNNDSDNSQQETLSEETEQKNKELYKVVRVIDGDTIELENGQKVRYIGIDTPETVHPEKSAECFGKEASEKNKEMVNGKKVKLEKDISETDKYGRLLRYVYLDDIFINDYLVRNGYANASSFPPDIKYQEQLTEAEKEARENKAGLWASNACKSFDVTPNSTSKNTTTKSGCNIKGNISSSGEKIYHVQGGQFYSKTAISISKGERWFCSEAEARNAGWRKSKR